MIEQIKKLTPEAKKLYAKLQKEWGITDTAGTMSLFVAMKAYDRLIEAQEVLATDGITITDRWGQKKIHPATQIEREARAGLIAALKLLDLDLDALAKAGGRK